MGKPVNYNDIVEIINSNIDLIENIVDVIKGKNLSKIINDNINDIKNLSTAISGVSKIISNIGDIQSSILAAKFNINVFKALIKLPYIKMLLLRYISIYEYISDILKKIDSTNVNELSKRVGIIKNVIDSIVSIINDVEKSKTSSKTIVYLNAISSSIAIINKLISNLNNIESVDENVAKNIEAIKNIICDFNELILIIIKLSIIAPISMISMGIVIAYVVELSLFIRSSIKILDLIIKDANTKKINQIFSGIKNVLRNILDISLYIIYISLIASLATLSIAMTSIFLSVFVKFIMSINKLSGVVKNSRKSLVNSMGNIKQIFNNIAKIAITIILTSPIMIASMPFMIVVLMYISALSLFLDSVFLAIEIISKFNKNTLSRLKNISLIIMMLGLIAIEIVLLAIASVPAILLSAVVVLYLFSIFLIFSVLYLVANLLGKIVSSGVVTSFLKTVGLIAVMMLIATELTILGVLAIASLIATPAIILFLIDLIVITGLFVAVGYVAVSVSSIIGVAISGLLSVLVLIGVMLLIAGALWLLGKIVIDTDKVLENVKTILSTASMIVEDIFNNDTKDQTKKSGDSKLGNTIVNMLGGMVRGLLSIITLIVGIPYLLMIFIAITLILFIVAALRLLQVIDLKPEKISENISIVLNTAKSIIDSIFSREQKDETKRSGGDSTLGGWIVDHLGDMVRGITSVINIIVGNIYLFMIFMAVAMILFIATTLRILQIIDLNPDAIAKNVGTVFKTADQVILSIFGKDREEKQPEKKNKPWYSSLFDWVCGFGKSFLGGLGKLSKLLVSVPYLVLILTSVGLVWSIITILNKIATFNLTSDAITAKVDDVIKVSNSVIDSMFNKNREIAKIDPRNNYKILKVLDVLSDFADRLTKLPTDSSHTLDIIKNLKLMRSANHNALYLLDYIQKQNLDHNKVSKSLDLLERFNEVSKKFVSISDDDVKKSKELTDNYIKFIDKVNGTNLESLKTTERLFKNMAEFSESINGNFDKLAEALNEKIAPLLEELKSLIEKVPQHIDKSAADQQRTLVETANNNINQGTYQRANISEPEAREMTKKSEKLTQSQYNRLTSIEKIVKILEGNDTNGGVKISKQR